MGSSIKSPLKQMVRQASCIRTIFAQGFFRHMALDHTSPESPIVFLVGLKGLFEIEQSLRLSDSEREALVRDCARKLYIAATRAGQRLVITCVGKLPEVIRSILSPEAQ